MYGSGIKRLCFQAIVKFINPPKGILVEVECKAYSLNIIHDRTNRLGMVHFEMLVEPTAAEKKEWEEKARRGNEKEQS